MNADISGRIRRIWDEDAASYDRSPAHNPQRPHEIAAWRAALRHLLPAPPARVLDVGAGTGFVSLMLAGQGFRVTALDFSSDMLTILEAKAGQLGLDVELAHGDAVEPPLDRTYDAVVERHVIWTLLDPGAALAAWQQVAPAGRLVLIEGTWTRTSGVAALQSKARRLARLLHGAETHQHDNYPEHVAHALPYVDGLLPAEAVRLVESSPWGAARYERLIGIEQAMLCDRSLIADLLGTPHRWAVSAGS